jgi:HSP20 family protein
MSHDEHDDKYDDEDADDDDNEDANDDEIDEKNEDQDKIVNWTKDSNWVDQFDPEIFKDIDMSQFEKFIENILKHFNFSNQNPNEGGPMVWGFSVNVGTDKKPTIRQLGNMNVGLKRKASQQKPEEPEPLIDTLEDDETITVIVEIPGITSSDIKSDTTETKLKLSIDTPQQKLSKEIVLPSEVEPESAKAWYKNGVLEIKLRKKTSNKSSTPINVT